MQTSTLRQLAKHKAALLSYAGACAFVALAFLLDASDALLAQTSEGGVPPVRVTALKLDRSGSDTMQIDRGMVVTQVVNATPRQMIEAAYGVDAARIDGLPAWAAKVHYDLSYEGGALSSVGTSAALQQVLADKFHLAVQRENRTVPVYALVVTKTGRKFQESTLQATPETGEPRAISVVNVEDDRGTVNLTGTVGSLADALQFEVDRPIVDRTALSGTYAIALHWTTAQGVASKSSAMQLSQALQQQLGLELVQQTASLPACAVLHIEQPAEN